MTVLQDTFQRKNNNIPIWFMRQAGRYLPEYMEIRKNVTDFLELCYDSEKAKAITLQPIERFDFDAAIIFSDILTIPDALGVKVEFVGGVGPKLQKISTIDDLKKLAEDDEYEYIKECLEKHISEKEITERPAAGAGFRPRNN